ncbi:enoyl-CoA hydratase-related protein [Candidatus Phycosocius spiralis]|uniref:Enoyl-CoA hydratase n=1 Tax=Candidatus Phycosocius spiralis TaxID=2815099 RepID=A0ABQ4PSM1_9PROT|nr:enoyl-CoA hydratase-related protein [Candidatus Phycosocius spiralis]GIU65986.1 enoyl-CoA hydratase [Candidatus Phycosocius spiralis]
MSDAIQDEPPVLLDISPDGVALVILNRPEKKNAFDEFTIEALTDIFETLRVADGVRIVFLRGKGTSFCAGADLEWMQRQAHHDFEDNELDAQNLAKMLLALHRLPQLTVALVQGGAFGGGAGLVAACDYAIALSDARFCFSEVRLGLTPATISPYVIEAIGARQARALFATAMPFDAQRAHEIGLVQEIASDLDDLAKREERLADLAFCAAPGSVAEVKELVRDVSGKVIDMDLGHQTARRIAHRRASPEGKEGLAAFLEKRQPSWSQT